MNISSNTYFSHPFSMCGMMHYLLCNVHTLLQRKALISSGLFTRLYTSSCILVLLSNALSSFYYLLAPSNSYPLLHASMEILAQTYDKEISVTADL